ncbi:MAG: anthranilate phosphoribosyltransferase [Arenicellales bacterium]
MSMRQYIQRIATGPELSKDLSREEAKEAAQQILSGAADPVQAAIFLIALRMKRETMDENRGVLDALLDDTNRVTARVPRVLDLADPYDGFTRGMPAAAFLPPVLAACGVPTVSNGAEAIGPKYGATHRKVLRAAGVPVDLKPEEAARRLEDPLIGWAYVDQRFACPALHALVDIRTRIVKRPCLTTLEVLLGPVRGAEQTHLVTGYVHKPYPPIYTALARQSGYTSAQIVRGVEGGVIPSLNQPSKFFAYHDDHDDKETRLDPIEFGIVSSVRAVPLPENLPSQEAQDDIQGVIDSDGLAVATAREGVEALEGVHGPFRESLVYGAAISLCYLGIEKNTEAAGALVRRALDSGDARGRFEAAKTA